MQSLVADAVREALEGSSIQPMRVYTAEEAGNLLGFTRWQTIYEIPECELPKCRIGPARRSVRYFGADLLAYLKGVDPLDVGAILDEVRSRIGVPAPVMPAPNAHGKTRIM